MFSTNVPDAKKNEPGFLNKDPQNAVEQWQIKQYIIVTLNIETPEITIFILKFEQVYFTNCWCVQNNCTSGRTMKNMMRHSVL